MFVPFLKNLAQPPYEHEATGHRFIWGLYPPAALRSRNILQTNALGPLYIGGNTQNVSRAGIIFQIFPTESDTDYHL